MDQHKPSRPRGRLAPSPTGRLHLGNAFAFLIAWLDIRSQGGSLILRMEDIDPVRSRPEHAADILKDMFWLGLDWDEGPDLGGPYGPYVQSERFERYATLIDNFAKRDLVYPCYCTRKELRMLASAPHIGDGGTPYPGTCRHLAPARQRVLEREGRHASLRLNTAFALESLGKANTRVFFDDLVKGRQYCGMNDCGGDFALRRSDGVFAYQLAVAADDAAMDVTRVARGEDLLLSTPRQILLFELLGKEPPRYAHIPLIHDHEGERLAKRHKSLALAALRAAGVRPEAVTGYLGYLASCIQKPEKRSPRDLMRDFDIKKLSQKKISLPPDSIQILLSL